MRRLTFNPIEGSFDYVDISPVNMDIVAFTISMINLWLNVPTILTKIFNVETFDEYNREKITIDFRVNPDNTLEVKSNRVLTLTIRIQGE